MGVIKQERDGLDRVLRRYVATGTVDAVLAEVEGRWHNVTATPWSPVSSTSRPVSSASPLGSDPPACVPVHEPALLQVHWGAGDPVGRNPPTRFSVVPQRSVVLIEARSSVGPITFGALGLTGVIEATIAGHRIDAQSAPRAHLEVDVAQFQSGNSLYDAELLRRIDARRHQKVALELRACTPLGETGRFRLEGTATFHGVTRPLEGTVSVTMTQSHKIVIRGEQTIDIRDFGVASPTVLMLRIYPDVVVKLQIEAESTSLEWDA